MENLEQKIKQLEEQINEFSKQQNFLNLQLFKISEELTNLKIYRQQSQQPATVELKTENILPEKIIPVKEKPGIPKEKINPIQQNVNTDNSTSLPAAFITKKYEDLIGRNIASKVGILITIIGVFIGAKYAIDKNLISPLVRIMSGYVAGVSLIFVAIRLKKKYENYSAVLLGGGLAVLYFLTYIAFSFYDIFSQQAAFLIMVCITVAAVVSAISYNKVIIANIGLIGAYAIPFLLSNNQQHYAVFLTYIAIINTGVLVISIIRLWKSLLYLSFLFTWIMFIAFNFLELSNREWQTLEWSFLSVTFLQFYGCVLVYKLIKNEKYTIRDSIIIILNAFIFYGLGYLFLEDNNHDNLTGAYTLFNAAIHFIIFMILNYAKPADKTISYIIAGLIITFITITVPVQFDGNWVTLLWAAETVTLCYAGLFLNRSGFQIAGLILSFLTVFSQVYNWGEYIDSRASQLTSFLNMQFFSAIITACLLSIVLWLYNSKKFSLATPVKNAYFQYHQFILPALVIALFYFTGTIEISLWADKIIDAKHSFQWMQYKILLLIAYSLLFIYGLFILNKSLFKKGTLGHAITILLALAFMITVTTGFYALSVLRIEYIQNTTHTITYYYQYHYSLIVLLVAGLFILNNTAEKFWITNKHISKLLVLYIHLIILFILSNEFLHWISLLQVTNQYKLGLSILWAVYALFLIVIGIRKKRSYLRIGAIVLFAITLIKLLLYDVAGLSTITKTITFISLGVILLIVSYLYNRYKNIILMKDE